MKELMPIRRFGKQKLIDELLKMEKDIQEQHNFDLQKGLSQFNPEGATRETREKIYKASMYGRMHAINDLR